MYLQKGEKNYIHWNTIHYIQIIHMHRTWTILIHFLSHLAHQSFEYQYHSQHHLQVHFHFHNNFHILPKTQLFSTSVVKLSISNTKIKHLASKVKEFVSNNTNKLLTCFMPIHVICTQLRSILLVGYLLLVLISSIMFLCFQHWPHSKKFTFVG